MPTNAYTPLRYPGGKAKLGPFIAEVLKANRLVDCEYAEPYAGGAGAAFFVLFRGYAAALQLNDIDCAVVSFWRAVLNQTDRFIHAIEKVPLTLKQWDVQRAIYDRASSGFELGFAFFFLNRTNRSGIMNGGVIGGRKQTGEWKIDARFNRADLIERIRAIASLRRRISVSQGDALSFLAELRVRAKNKRRKQFVYLDPPYFGKGRDLYTNFYSAEDHGEIARRLKCETLPWLLTYDDCVEIRNLYAGLSIRQSELSYSARRVYRGREIVVFGPNLHAPKIERAKSRHAPGFEMLPITRPSRR